MFTLTRTGLFRIRIDVIVSEDSLDRPVRALLPNNEKCALPCYLGDCARITSKRESCEVGVGYRTHKPTLSTLGPLSQTAKCLLLRSVQLSSPTSRATLEHVPVMQQAVEHGADRGGIAHQFAPVFDRAVGGQQRAGPLVAAHDDLQQFLGGGERQLAHSQIVDDEQGHGHQEPHVLFASAVERGFGQCSE